MKKTQNSVRFVNTLSFWLYFFVHKLDAIVTINRFWNEYYTNLNLVDFYIDFSIKNTGYITISECTVIFQLTYSDNTIDFVDVWIYKDIEVGETYTTTEWIYEVDKTVIDVKVSKIELEDWNFNAVTIEY